VLPSLPLTGGRRTIARAVALDGIGLHLGQPCRLVFRPAAPRAGVFFRRLDLPDAPIVPALVGVAVEAQRRTQLGVGEAALHTVEHVLAAVGALGIDDVEIGLDAPEPPIMDGSAAPFLSALAEAGLVSHGGTAEWLVLRRSLRVVDGDSGKLSAQAVAIKKQTQQTVWVTGVAIGAKVVSAGAQKLDAGLTVRPILRTADAAEAGVKL
jgi:UDP-3-O-acyl-N-acetylglucosamine deacetylase